jgi:hypothetical protein
MPPLGEKIARHTHEAKCDAEKGRSSGALRDPKSRFAKLDTIDDVIQKLIGV